MGGHFKTGSENFPLAVSYNGNGRIARPSRRVIGLTGSTWLGEVLGSDALTLYATTEHR
jgi:hypothetical protein